MRLLALDTSTTRTGLAMFDNGNLVKSWAIDLGHVGDTNRRLEEMVRKIYDAIGHYSPTAIVAELTVVMRNPQTQRLLTMLLGAVYGKCVADGITFDSLRPTEWRKLADPGKKPRKREELKKWSVDKVRELYNIDVNDDVADAVLIGVGYLNKRGEK